MRYGYRDRVGASMSSMRTKVLFIVTKSNWGGAQRYVFDLATNLPQHYDPAVACGGTGLLTEKLRAHGVRVHSIEAMQRDMSMLREISAFVSLLSVIRRERPHIVHLNSSKAGVLGAVAARLLGVPKIVFSAHGWAYHEKRLLFIQWLWWLGHAATLALATDSIAVSEHIFRTAPFRRRMRIILHGIELYPPKQQHAPNDPIEILTIAELHRNKGIDVLLRALALLKPGSYRATVIGEGQERENLESLASLLQVAVHLPGFIENASDKIDACDLFVLPSRTEALGYVLLEAGRAACAAIGTRVGGIPEVIEDGVSGRTVEPENPEALAAALRSLVEDSALRNQYAAALRARVESVFRLDRMVAETAAVYVA